MSLPGHPQSMKMGSSPTMIVGPALEEGRLSLVRNSPRISLAWTSSRTPNCRLAGAKTRRAECFPFDVLQSRQRGADHGESGFLLCWTGCAQGIGGSLRAKDGTERPAPSANSSLGNHGRGPSGHGRLVRCARGQPCGHGKHGGFWKPIFNILVSCF